MRDTFHFDYRPNLTDIRAGLKLGSWGTLSKNARTLFLLFGLPLLLFGGLINATFTGLDLGTVLLFAAAVATLWGVLFAVLFGAWLARYILRRELHGGATQQLVVDTSGVERRAQGTKHHLSWSAVSHICEHERFFLLFAGERAIGSIEKSAIQSSSDLTELRAFLQTLKPLQAA
jgi:hypothetical protein